MNWITLLPVSSTTLLYTHSSSPWIKVAQFLTPWSRPDAQWKSYSTRVSCRCYEKKKKQNDKDRATKSRIPFETFTFLSEGHLGGCKWFLVCWKKPISGRSHFRLVLLAFLTLRERGMESWWESSIMTNAHYSYKTRLHNCTTVLEITPTFPSIRRNIGSHLFV